VTEIDRSFDRSGINDRELSARYLEISRAFLINGWGWSESDFRQFVRDRTIELRRWPEWFNDNDPGGHVAAAVIPVRLWELNGTEKGWIALFALVDDMRHIIEAATDYYTTTDVDWAAVGREMQTAIQQFEARRRPRLRRRQRISGPKGTAEQPGD
jgi:hypothetical protein